MAADAVAATPATVVKATPAQIIQEAPPSQWIAVAPEDLLVMDLPALPPRLLASPAGSTLPYADTQAAAKLDGEGTAPIPTSPQAVLPAPAQIPRRVVIQLISPPYSQGWVANIRALAAEHWWDGLAIVRAQDNYVVQWGDPEAENSALARRLPGMLQKMPSADYVSGRPGDCGRFAEMCPPSSLPLFTSKDIRDAYAQNTGFVAGWPVALEGARSWPVHCYGTVGVGRNVAPDTGTGAELYVVIGQAPRQLDRNIALVGRVIEGIEHLSTLPRGTAELGFYAKPEERTPILSIRSGNEVPNLPRYEYLSTAGDAFAQYVHSRANRQDDFYVQPAGAVDVCNVPVPVRRMPAPTAGKKKRGK